MYRINLSVAVVDMMGVKGGNRSIAGDCPVGKMLALLSLVHNFPQKTKTNFSFATGLSGNMVIFRM